MLETQNNQSTDEIDLIDIIGVLWKRKKLIIIGTISCVLFVAAINFFLLPKIYRTDMVVQPGILKISQNGSEKNIFIDSAVNMKAIILAGSFNNRIIQVLKATSGENIPDDIQYQISIPKNSNILKISYESDIAGQGEIVLTALRDLLVKEYEKFVIYHKSLYDFELELKKNEIKKMEADKVTYVNMIKNLEKRIKQLRDEIKEVNKSTRILRENRDRFLSKAIDENNVLSSMLYSNSIQNNLALSNNYKEQLNTYISKKEAVLLNIKKIENDISDADQKIKHLVFQKDSIQNIQVVQPPTCERKPVKPRKTINIIMSAVIGFFLMLIVVLVVEYLSKNRKLTDIK